MSDTHFPGAAKIVLEQDNLSTHTAASLYAAFAAPEARRLNEWLKWHCAPKHGRWLDMAECELGMLATKCLDRRIPDKSKQTSRKADRQFTTGDARIKLKRLYPQFG